MIAEPRARTRPPACPPRLPAILRRPDELAAHLEDAAHLAGGHARGLAFPEHEGEVAALCSLGLPLLAVGAQSSVTGGGTPMGELLVSTSRLTGIELLPGGAVRAGAGVSLADLEAFLAAHGRTYPPAPTWTAATVGGIVSTNAAGPATFKYGVTRDWVVGLTVVLAGGDVLDLARGEVTADTRGVVTIGTSRGEITLRIPPLRWPEVPKCSAGYACAAGMDLVDLFIGAEGTLGIVVEATLRTVALQHTRARAIVPCPSAATALAVADALRTAARSTWATQDRHGLDIAAIEHLDGRSLEVVREDGVLARERITLPPDTTWLLLVDLELPATETRASAWARIAHALDDDAPDGPLVRFCRLADRHGLLDAIEVALPGDAQRLAQFAALREAVPAGVNARVARAREAHGSAVRKVAGDMIVPWSRLPEFLDACERVFARRGLDHAVWGHLSDGNLHPNLLPRSAADVEAGEAAVRELGETVIALGGSPLAEHGVGRLPLKKQLLRLLHGEDGVTAMRAIKQALDPAGVLAPGVLF